jgi:hypothetical protein
MSVEKAKQYAATVQKSGHELDKLDNIAKALYELADALEVIEKKIERKG